MRTRIAGWDRSRRSGPVLGGPSPCEEEILDELGCRFEKYNDALHERYGIDTSDWRPHQRSRTAP